MTTSLEVARIFGKAHYSVLREILEENASNLKINKSHFKLTRNDSNVRPTDF